MKFPGFGRDLWQRRLNGERPRVVQLLVGEHWRSPKWMPRSIPRLAVKTEAWHDPYTERREWRVVAGMTVLAIDVRLQDERVEGPDGWDAWLWLLADVQRHARDVLLFTPTIDLVDPPGRFAPERDLETYAWLNRSLDPVTKSWTWPAWWPHEDEILEAAA